MLGLKIKEDTMFGVYRDYDGYAADSKDIFVLEDEKDAILVARLLNAINEREEGSTAAFACIEGYEWCGQWSHHPIRPNIDSLEEVVDSVRANIQDYDVSSELDNILTEVGISLP